jgi:hypothetical protein
MQRIVRYLTEENHPVFIFGMISAAFASCLVYWIALVQPASVLRLYPISRLDEIYLKINSTMAVIRMVLGFVVLGAAYLLAYKWARHVHGWAGWVTVFAGMLAFGAILLYLAPFDSTDIYDNIIHGRILALYHANPFKDVANQFPYDPFTRFTGWPKDPSAYGPLWEWMAAGVARLAGNGQVQNLMAFKLLSGLFTVLTAGVIGLILQVRTPGRALPGTLLFAWNPVVLFETFGHGHNDPAMMFWVVVAVWALTKKHYTGAILALIMGALVKYVPLIFLPAAGLIALQAMGTRKRKTRFVILVGLLSFVLVVIAFAPFWHGIDTLSAGKRAKLFATSLPASLFFAISPKVGFETTAILISIISFGLTAVFALWIGFRAMRSSSPDRFPLSAMLTLDFYLLGTVLWFWPWYTIWLLALAPLVENRRVRSLAVVFSFSTLAKSLLYGPLFTWTTHPLTQPMLEIAETLLVMVVPWGYALYSLVMYWKESGVRLPAGWFRQPAPSQAPAWVEQENYHENNGSRQHDGRPRGHVQIIAQIQPGKAGKTTNYSGNHHHGWEPAGQQIGSSSGGDQHGSHQSDPDGLHGYHHGE